jgi:cytochrome oxidase Cu insertion factor (SCO1/SenC/PrrC family)/cytochrome c2
MTKAAIGSARHRGGWAARQGAAAAFMRRLPALFAGALALVGAQALAAPQGSRFNAEYFTNLPVTTHEGKTVPFYDGLIKGKTVVFTFIYLSCNDICPLTTSRIAKIREELGDAVGRDVFIYSVTMDPENDTPELLKEYAEVFGAGDGWQFITGKPEDIKTIRWRLGERSRKLAEHRNDMMLGNDFTGEWSRSSVYADIEVSVNTIRALDPAWRAAPRTLSKATPGVEGYRLDEEPGHVLFVKACSTCHTIGGGDLVGPDLKDIAKRRDQGWLAGFLAAPERMRAKKDPLALEISEKYKGVKMPNLGLGERDIADLLTYIGKQSLEHDARADDDAAVPASEGTGATSSGG